MANIDIIMLQQCYEQTLWTKTKKYWPLCDAFLYDIVYCIMDWWAHQYFYRNRIDNKWQILRTIN